MSAHEIKVPDTEQFKEAEVIEVKVKMGDSICIDQPLITLVSNDESLEILSTGTGVVTEITAKVGEKVTSGALLITLEIKPTPVELDTVVEAISVSLSFIDPMGKGIAQLSYRIVIGAKTTEGITDESGNAKFLDNVKPEIPLEIFVKRDDGTWASKYKGQTSCSDMSMCAQSPHLKMALTPEEHKGEEQPAVPKPSAVDKPAIPKPALPPAGQIKGGEKQPEVKAQTSRDEKGHPVVKYKGISDWASRHLVPAWAESLYDNYKSWRKGEDQKNGSDKANASAATSPSVAVTSLTQAAPSAVTQLISLMDEQVTWDWNNLYEKKPNGKGLNSGSIIAGIKNKTLEPPTGKEAGKSHGRCYPSVKIGLMRATLVRDIWDDIPAKGAGKWLQSQGFVDVFKTVPDARWAAPGDIVVYRYDDETEKSNITKYKAVFEKYEADKKAFPETLKQWETQHLARQNTLNSVLNAPQGGLKGKAKEKNKFPKEAAKPVAPKEPDAENWGHIDVRTYDGYMSDFKTEVLPRAVRLASSKGFVVTGIYRKIYDPLPDLRVRAFLKVIREWECHSIVDDSRRYFALQRHEGDKEQPYFSDTSTHPYSNRPEEKGSFSGAYQIKYDTWKELVTKFGMPAGFTPELQDRFAVAKIEGRHALGLIRQGKIREAIGNTQLTKEWSSLAGGVHARKGKNLDDLLIRYNQNLEELIKK